ncbi:MAG TPA: sigma-54 dependent transcriptional regulator [Thermoanaerobaculia bacterium]|nr:sigma-54 dependent transcriptional regulator [Thermoanaerobaculia bacterium]
MPSKKRRDPRLGDFFRSRAPSVRNLLQTVEKVLDHDVPVLIRGESGTGKDFLAEAIHICSNRRSEPFVEIDCPSIPADLFESELFGHEKGTFTDAQSRKLGKLEVAGAGTVYFDEISALSSSLQAKLLRAFQEKSLTRLGGNQAVPFRARVVSSTSADLESLLAAGTFRRDLFYRINVVTVTMPPLRERADDIPLLAAAFAGGPRRITSEAMDLLTAYGWPGNLRELRNAIERALLLAEGDAVTAAALPFEAPELVAAATRAGWTLEKLEETYIREVLRSTRSNFSRAAQVLGINRKTLLEKRRKYGIE